MGTRTGREHTLCREEILELLNGGVGLVVGHFDLGRWFGSLLSEHRCESGKRPYISAKERGGT